MNISDQVLALLRESSDPLSGEEMAQRLGVSRNTVWKAVQKLRNGGFAIGAGTNRGYVLLSESGVLSPENIAGRLSGAATGCTICVLEEATSTNTVAKELAEQGKPEGAVVIAQQQTAGKGRLGRSFSSPPETGLYMSILLRPKFSAEESLSITTAAAVAVAGAVEAVTGQNAQIKWVNDVYLNGYKVCGILTEASIDFETQGLRYAVLGIGVNIQTPAGGFPEELKEIAGALYEKDAPPETRAAVAAEILNRFFGFYQTLTDRPFLPEYRRRSLLTGMEISFVSGSTKQKGTVLGVDGEARLRVRLKNGEERLLSAGEATIEKDFLEKLRKGKNDGKE